MTFHILSKTNPKPHTNPHTLGVPRTLSMSAIHCREDFAFCENDKKLTFLKNVKPKKKVWDRISNSKKCNFGKILTTDSSSSRSQHSKNAQHMVVWRCFGQVVIIQSFDFWHTFHFTMFPSSVYCANAGDDEGAVYYDDTQRVWMGTEMTKRTEEKHFCQAGGVLKSMIFFWPAKSDMFNLAMLLMLCCLVSLCKSHGRCWNTDRDGWYHHHMLLNELAVDAHICSPAQSNQLPQNNENVRASVSEPIHTSIRGAANLQESSPANMMLLREKERRKAMQKVTDFFRSSLMPHHHQTAHHKWEDGMQTGYGLGGKRFIN